MALPKIYFSGNLTREPELRYTNDGKAVVNFSVACSQRRLNKQTSQWEDGDVTFLDCSMFDKAAETIAQLSKGTAVKGEGVLKTDSWNDKTTGDKRTKLTVRVDELGEKLKPAKNSFGGSAPDATSFGGGSQDTPPF